MEIQNVLLKKTTPQNIEAEQYVLGGIFLDNESIAKVLETIRIDDFYKEIHKKIFSAMRDLYNLNQPIDPVTVGETLRKANVLNEIGGLSYLTLLATLVPTSANITYYANIIKEKFILRTLIERAVQITEMCYNQTAELDELLDKAESSIFEMTQSKLKPSFFPINEIVKEVISKVEHLFENKEAVSGVPTGFIELDKLTSGLQNADLIVIAGRPGMGKTSLCLNIAQNVALKEGIPVAIFSLETSKDQLCLRMLCSEARVDSSRLRSGIFTQYDFPRLIEAATDLSDSPIYIDDTPALSVMDMRTKTRRLKADKNIGLIIVDYLQLMKCNTKSEIREQEISEISRSLKALAKELDIPIVALSQLNRRVEERHDKKPQLADLRESGAIEQDADVIMFLYRDELYNKAEDNPQKGIAEVHIGKHRNGPTGVVKLEFLDKYTTFNNLDTFHTEPPF